MTTYFSVPGVGSLNLDGLASTDPCSRAALAAPSVDHRTCGHCLFHAITPSSGDPSSKAERRGDSKAATGPFRHGSQLLKAS